MTTFVLRWTSYVAILALILYSSEASAEAIDKETKAIRTDVIDKSVLALKAVFDRTIRNCDGPCREERNAKLSNLDLEDRGISNEAMQLTKKILMAESIDLELVNSWIDRAGDIQRNYFNSVFQYHKNGGAVRDALFYLDIGEPHKAAEELLANQRTLTQIGADCSVVFEVGQAGRSGIAFRLLNQLFDVNPYHVTFGCMQSTIESTDDQPGCAAVMRTTFEASFIHLQEILTKVLTTEITEDDLLLYEE